MDKRIQRYLTLIILMMTMVGYAQCPSSDIILISDTTEIKEVTYVCNRVSMSPEKFAYYFLAEKNLQAIKDSIPVLAAKIETERTNADRIIATSEEQIILAQETHLLLMRGQQECEEALIQIALKNMKLKNKVKRKNKVIKASLITGLAIGFLVGVIIP